MVLIFLGLKIGCLFSTLENVCVKLNCYTLTMCIGLSDINLVYAELSALCGLAHVQVEDSYESSPAIMCRLIISSLHMSFLSSLIYE